MFKVDLIVYLFRYWGDDELDRLSVTSRKMVTYTRVDCVGASKVINITLNTLNFPQGAPLGSIIGTLKS